MKIKNALLLVLISISAYAQRNLDYYLQAAYNNNPTIIEQHNLIKINNLQRRLDYSQNSGFQIYLTTGYIFAPYFNNSSGLITTNPDQTAIGYDIALTSGGLYSTLINVEKNLFNTAIIDALDKQRTIAEQTYKNNIELLKRDLRKQITDQYLQTYLAIKFHNLTNEIISYMQDQLTILGELVETGMAKQSEYLLLSIEIDNQRISANDYYSQYVNNLFELNSMCGIKDTTIAQLEMVNLEFQNNRTSSELFKKFELDSISIINQQQIFETKYNPQVMIYFNSGLNAVELSNIQRKFGMSAGLNLSMPIYDGNQRSITQQQTSVYLETIKTYRTNLENQIQNQRKSIVNKIITLKNNLNSLRDQIDNYNAIIKISEKELQQGQISMIEYLTILKNYLDFKKNMINAEINYQLEINNYNYWNY